MRKKPFVLGFTLLAAVAMRYVPEYLRLLGARAWLVGLFGSVVLALPLVARRVRNRVCDATRRPNLALGLLATAGLVLWLSAPYFGAFSLVVVAFEPWVWVLAGLPLVLLWRPTIDGFDGLLVLLRRTHRRDPSSWSAAKRRAKLLTAVGVAVGLFAGAPDFLSGFQVLLALAGSVALTAAVSAGIRDRCADYGHPSPPLPSRSTIRAALRDRPPTVRSLLLGDALVQFAVGMVAFFFVIVVVHHHRLTVNAPLVRFGPDAVFALLLVVETLVAAGGSIFAVRLADELDSKTVVAGGLLATSLVPLLFVTTPSVALAVVLFGCLGGFLAIRPAREALLAEHVSREVFEAYRVARRMAVVPAPLVGGLLYGFSPQFAFGLATCVGLLGCWEFLRFVRRSRW